ncbi:hypothetical protein [Paraburkholderia mimosarum]|uniref:hypothetical protein n=1 Tax=Paraburkholderia mimosarum TaxID=312026 RepID=UPI0012DCD0EA|nr:hypothetical protein [Paraburkholderia mimosarum]
MSHRCRWPGCESVVGNDLWGCKAHWRSLPSPVRAWIGRAYRQGMDTDTHPTPSYGRAHRAALGWIRARGSQGDAR